MNGVALLADSAVDWTMIVVAAIAGAPAILAAVFAYLNGRRLRTPSGTSIGQQVESAHHVAIANNQWLQSVAADVGTQAPAKAAAHEAQVHEPPEPAE